MTERLTALVTGVGGVYGLGCIENLRRSTLPIRIVGADTRWNAAGLFRSDATAILPSVDTGGYVDALLSCCEDELVDIVFFCSGAEIQRVSRLRDQLDAGGGCLFVVNSEALVTLASDKLASMTALADLGLQVPQSRACTSVDAIPSIVEELGFPVIAKPRFGQGSRGIFAFETLADMDAGFTISEEYVVQERIGDEDHENTVGVVGAEDGAVYGSIVLRRWLKDGLTVGTTTKMISIKSRKNPSTNMVSMTTSTAPITPPGTSLRISWTMSTPQRPAWRCCNWRVWRIAGATVTQLALAAKAHHVLEDYGAAEEVYKRWLRKAPPDHPDRKKMALALFQAQKLDPFGPQPGGVFRDCTECPEMVVIPAGEFVMGSPESELGRFRGEGPRHTVRIERPFALGKYEVTFAEWDACVADRGCNGYRPDDEGWGRDKRPAINVTWDEASAYLSWLSRKSGKRYGFASESEWEYAARAGTTTARFWGEDADRGCGSANLHDRTSMRSNKMIIWTHHKCDDGYALTAPVGSFTANAFGVHDMLGNVSEWTEDCRNDSYKGAPNDGSVWFRGKCELRVLRGGSWSKPPRAVRTAFRWSSGGFQHDVGFRVARTLD